MQINVYKMHPKYVSKHKTIVDSVVVCISMLHHHIYKLQKAIKKDLWYLPQTFNKSFLLLIQALPAKIEIRVVVLRTPK